MEMVMPDKTPAWVTLQPGDQWMFIRDEYLYAPDGSLTKIGDVISWQPDGAPQPLLFLILGIDMGSVFWCQHITMMPADVRPTLLDEVAQAVLVLAKQEPMAIIAVEELPVAHQQSLSRAKGYTGDPCTQCGLFMLKQSGHCLVCDACGTTTGCS
jgi:hypothetical protein